MKPLRIVHSEAATSLGGQERRILKEMLAMRERGHYLEAICQPDAELVPVLREQGFIVHTLFMDGIKNYLLGVFQLRRLLKQGQFNVVNTHSRRDTVLAGAAARLAKIPLVVRTRHLARKPGSLWSYTKIPHRVVTVSDYVRQGLLDKGVAPHFVKTIYSPIDLPELAPFSTLPAELNLPENAIVVGCVAVMRRPKGHIDLIDALAPILRQRPDVHAVFVGDGSPVFEEVSHYIAEQGLEQRIHLLGRRNDISNVLAGFTIFALATHEEASGTVFVEASAAGLPVIGTNVGGVSEMFEDNVSGLLVPVKNPDAMRQALIKLIDNPDLRKQMGKEGYQAVRISGRFSAQRMAQETESVYYQWLEQLQR